jgi:hypothetical protein
LVGDSGIDKGIFGGGDINGDGNNLIIDIRRILQITEANEEVIVLTEISTGCQSAYTIAT